MAHSQPTPFPDDTPLEPTTDKIARECPKFRILIIGRSGTGKSSLINEIFKAPIADVKHDEAGHADINREITSEHNKHFILHDSLGYEPGDDSNFDILKSFIVERSQETLVADRLHVIWLCIAVPHAGSRFLEAGDEKIFQLFQLKRNKVPIIVVFTMFDLMVADAEISLAKDGVDKEQIRQKSEEVAAKNFRSEYNKSFKNFSRSVIDERCVLVSSMGAFFRFLVCHRLVRLVYRPETLQQLVKITMKNIHIDIPSPSTKFRLRSLFNPKATTIEPTKADEDLSDSAQITLATAQRILMEAKITASIEVGKKKYWTAITSGALFSGRSLASCLNAIHKDIITIWNIRGLDRFLFSDGFRAQMAEIVSDLSDKKQDNYIGPFRGAFATAGAAAGMASGIAASAAAGPAAVIVAPVVAAVLLAAWGYNVYQQTPGIIRCLMGYVVDLTLILQAVFRASRQDKEGLVAEDFVRDIIEEFDHLDKKKRVHDEIKGFVEKHYPFTKTSAVGKIESLIAANKEFFTKPESVTLLGT